MKLPLGLAGCPLARRRLVAGSCWPSIIDNRAEGSALNELCQVLPALSRNQVQKLLRELKAEGRVRPSGATKGARWHPAP